MPYEVNIYRSVAEVLEETGVILQENLDESLLEQFVEVDDEVITNGGLFTLVKGGAPADTQILAKGLYYTFIVYTPDVEEITNNGEAVTHIGEPVTHQS